MTSAGDVPVPCPFFRETLRPAGPLSHGHWELLSDVSPPRHGKMARSNARLHNNANSLGLRCSHARLEQHRKQNHIVLKPRSASNTSGNHKQVTKRNALMQLQAAAMVPSHFLLFSRRLRYLYDPVCEPAACCSPVGQVRSLRPYLGFCVPFSPLSFDSCG